MTQIQANVAAKIAKIEELAAENAAPEWSGFSRRLAAETAAKESN